MTTQIVIDMSAQGAQQTPPATLLSELTQIAANLSPGYTNNLPASMIEDIASTDLGALTVIDSATVDLINSISPFTANPFLLNQLGQIYGVQQGQDTNTSVYLIFSGTVGFTVPIGFTVSDGTYQYIVQDGGIVETGGQTAELYALASVQGSWAIPINTVTTLITSVPAGVTLSVMNPSTGLQGAAAQTIESYRAQVIQAGLSACQGTPAMIKTQLGKVAGVQPNLISVRSISGSWEVICGGGDPYAVANAIFQGICDVNSLVGSSILVIGITNASPGVVTTNLNHGYSTGQVAYINGAVGITGVNGIALTCTVLTEKTFSIGIDTTSSGAWTSGGIVTPNFRNVSVSINDYPDTYIIPFVNPPVQTVGITLTWNTTSTNYVSPTAISQLGTPALMAYINGIAVGQPINVFEMQNVFQLAIASVLPAVLLSRMVFVVTINGVTTSVTSGTGLIVGDPESYFAVTAGNITISQG